MFGLLRLLLGGIIAALVVFLCRKAISSRQIMMVYILLFIVIPVCLWFVPLENVFVTFKSPEAAFDYSNTNNADVCLVVNGEKSAFVVAKKTDAYVYLIVPKTEKGWGVGIGLHTKHNDSFLKEDIAVDVYRHRGTEDYYITVFNTNGGFLTVTDSYGSTFTVVENANAYTDKTYYTYYAYLPEFNEQYRLCVNGTQLNLE